MDSGMARNMTTEWGTEMAIEGAPLLAELGWGLESELVPHEPDPFLAHVRSRAAWTAAAD